MAGRLPGGLHRTLKIHLHVGRGPIPTQRFVELDNRAQLGAASARQRESRIEEAPLGRQHIALRLASLGKAMLNVMLDRLDDHNGIDHD